MGKSGYIFDKQLTDEGWCYVCISHQHVPFIKLCKDGKYAVKNCNGKTIIHNEFKDAKKLAIETAEKFSKLNKSWTE
jgi:hypothetical protein